MSVSLGAVAADGFRVRLSAAETPHRTPNKSLIVFWTHGGMSQQDTYDMKPDRNDPTAVGTAEMADAIIAKMQQG